MIEWYRRGPKMRIFVFPPPRAPVTPPPPRVRPGHVNRTSPPAALRNCGAERVFAPPAARKGRKIALFAPFTNQVKTRSAPQLRDAAGGDVLLTCPGPVARRWGRHGGARGRKDENPHFRYHSSLNQIVQYIVLLYYTVALLLYDIHLYMRVLMYTVYS